MCQIDFLVPGRDSVKWKHIGMKTAIYLKTLSPDASDNGYG